MAKNTYQPGWRRSRQWLIAGIIALVFGSFALVAQAQLPILQRASVVLDGRPLLEVAQSNQITAEERAEMISRTLEDEVDRNTVLFVTTAARGQSSVLLVNDRYLMTVTQEDANINGVESPSVLAAEWANTLHDGIRLAQSERQVEVLQQRLVIAASLLVVAFLVHRLLGYLWSRSLSPLLFRFTAPQDEASPPAGLRLLLGMALTGVRFILWFGVITYITNLFPMTRRWSYFLRQQALVGFLKPNLRLGQSEFSLLSLLVLLGMLLGWVVLSGTFTNFLRSRILRLTGMDRGSREALSVLIKYSLIFIGTVVVLQIWGLDLSSLALIASALGVGIGLGLQNIAKDFSSGLILVFERPIQVGDFVEFEKFQGTVERIGSRSTEIKTLDQISIIVPNSYFLEQEVINWSHQNPVSRIRLPVGVAYHSDPKQVKEVLIETGYQHPQVLSKPPPTVFFKGFGESALNFELLVWIADPAKQPIIKSDLYFAIEAAMRQHGIEIPFPQQDLHIRSSSLPIDLATRDRPS